MRCLDFVGDGSVERSRRKIFLVDSEKTSIENKKGRGQLTPQRCTL